MGHLILSIKVEYIRVINFLRRRTIGKERTFYYANDRGVQLDTFFFLSTFVMGKRETCLLSIASVDGALLDIGFNENDVTIVSSV